MQCRICSEKFKSAKKLSLHVRYAHKISAREYYDTHVKSVNDGVCKFCGNNTSYVNIVAGYKNVCSSTACKSLAMKEIRQQNATDPEKHAAFVQKVSNNQKAIWADRKAKGVDKAIHAKAGATARKNNSKMTAEERKYKFGWMNSLSIELKEEWVKTVMLKTGAHRWWKEATDSEKLDVVVKREATKKQIAEELIREYMSNPESKQLYYAAVQYLTEQTYHIHKEKIDPNGNRGREWHLDHRYSVFQGFINGVPPEIIAHQHNLILISAKKNLQKGSNCTITLEELQLKYAESLLTEDNK